MDGLGEVQCPSCFEFFAVPVPPPAECPTDLGYDCEVCCRPMVLSVDQEGQVQARSIDDFPGG